MKALQKVAKRQIVAYLGPEGTFCEQAARKCFQSSSEDFVACPTIKDVFIAVEEGNASNGVVPVENSLEGSERRTLDLLLEKQLMISGEVDLRIVHNLMIRPGSDIGKIKTILSHPQALAQCRRFLEKHFPNVELKEVNSTAKAVQSLADLEDSAAIGTEVAAERYGMDITQRQIEDDPNNFTRFFILSKEDKLPSGRDKTSLIFSVRDEPGSLYNILGIFAEKGLNLAKVESRPMRGRPWKYIFYLDFEGHRTDPESKEALREMTERCIFVKVLGSYPKT
jgi:chorismate mutase/prephenate dehydratase